MRVNILGVTVDNLSLPESVARVTAHLKNNVPVTVYTPNPIMISHAIKDSTFRDVLNRATFNLPDGIGLLWAAKILSLPLTNRVAGIEFGQALLSYAAQKALRVYLLGGKPGIAAQAAQKLKQKYPNLIICGTHHGYFSENQSPALCQKIEQAQTDILFVCLGSPRQEIWLDTYHPHGVQISAALGGSLDVWSGSVKRAPRLLSNVGLEWLWRMILSPRRAKNLTHILHFLLTAYKERPQTPRTPNFKIPPPPKAHQ